MHRPPRTLTRRLLTIFGVLVGIVLILVGGSIGVLAMRGAPLVADLIRSWASEKLGRDVSIGALHITWSSPIQLVADDVRVANTAWGAASDFLSIPRLTAEIDRGALLRLRLAIETLELAGPRLSLETAENDESNWTGLLGEPSEAATVELRRLRISDARVTRQNRRTQANWELAVSELKAEAPDAHQPIEVSATGVFQDERFSAEAQLGPRARLREKSWPSPARLEAQLGGNVISLAGAASQPRRLEDLDLRVDMKGDDLQRVLALVGVPIPRVPLYRLAGHVRRSQAAWTIDGLEGQIGNSHVSGRVLVDLTQRVHYVRAELKSRHLELADLKGFYGGLPERASGGGERVMPNFRIPTEELLRLNADVHLDAPSVKPSAGIPFERLTFAVSLRDGTLRIENARLGVAKGAIAGRGEFRATEKPPRIVAEIEAGRIDWRRFFAAMDVPPAVKETAGLVGVSAKLRSSGEDQRQIFARLDGEIAVFVQDAQLGGKATTLFDLRVAEALGLAEGDQRVLPIHCGIGHFVVTRGVATAQTLVLATPGTHVVGAGNVNFADETLFLDLRPQPRPGGPPLGGVRVPVRVRGTFGEPDASADRAGLAARLGTALGLAPVTLPASLLPLLERGLGPRNACAASFAASPPGHGEGSSSPSSRAPRPAR